MKTGREDKERATGENLLAIFAGGLATSCFVTIHSMQSFDTKADDLPPGACIRLALPDGNELAVFNVDGEYYAIENSCPHKGAPLSEGAVCGHIVECWWHGWQFDVRTGECLTVPERIRTYPVIVEDGLLKILVHP